MHFFSQYRGLRRENYVLFFGRIVTNLGSMVWPMLTMILNQKLGMSAGNIAVLTAVFGVLMMPANLLGGKLADRLNKKLRRFKNPGEYEAIEAAIFQELPLRDHCEGDLI